jgi:hypothetical protein
MIASPDGETPKFPSRPPEANFAVQTLAGNSTVHGLSPSKFMIPPKLECSMALNRQPSSMTPLSRHPSFFPSEAPIDVKTAGYFKIIEESNINSLFSVLLEDHINPPLVNSTNLINKKYDIPQNLGYRVDIKELMINSERHHQTKIKFSMSHHP